MQNIQLAKNLTLIFMPIAALALGYMIIEMLREWRLNRDLEQYNRIQDAIKEALEYAEDNKEFFEAVVRAVVLSDPSYIEILKRVIEENDTQYK
jgi:uncharacterized protein YbaP (TraB family)